MNRAELKEKLSLLGINPKAYSLNGEMIPDCIILIEGYEKWQVFYLDERGGKNNEGEFKSEDDACQYIYQMFIEIKGIEQKFGIKI